MNGKRKLNTEMPMHNKTTFTETNVNYEEEEYEELARAIGSDICQYEPSEQNEMLKIIHHFILNHRKAVIEETEKKTSILKSIYRRYVTYQVKKFNWNYF